MKKRHSSHQTQWAAQFAAASELCKRDADLGNHPAVDLMVQSPKGDSSYGSRSPATRPRPGSPGKSPKRSPGHRPLPIWCAIMTGPMGMSSSLASGRWASATGRSLLDRHGKMVSLNV